MKNLRWYEDYPKNYKVSHSFLFKTSERPPGFRKRKYYNPPSNLCFAWRGTLGKLYRYDEMNDKQKEALRNYSIWIVEPKLSEEELFELFEKSSENLKLIGDNIGPPTALVWKQLRVLEHHYNNEEGMLLFER